MGHPQTEGGEAQGLLCFVMEEWRRTPVATCGALVMPKRVKAVLENNGGHTKY